MAAGSRQSRQVMDGRRRGAWLWTVLVAAAAMLLADGAMAQQDRFLQAARPMPMGRGFHGSAVMGDHLYVFGGRSSDGLQRDVEIDDTSVWRAPISGMGQIGEWSQTTPLPQPRYYVANSTLVLNDVVYIVGGSDAVVQGNFHNTAIYSKPLPDGRLTPWQTSAPFAEGLNCPTAVTTPGHLHIIAGLNKDSQVSNRVFTNSVFPDGSLSQWESGPPLPMPLWFHNAEVVAGRVYVWGGLAQVANTEASQRVFSAPIQGNGKIGAWRMERVYLPAGFYSASSAVAGPFLMSFSPRYARGVISADVWYTRITPAGMEAWQRRETEIPNRVYHAVAPDYRRGSIYITGGRGPVRDTPLNRASNFFLLNAQLREQAERSWVAAQAAHSNSVSALGAQIAGGAGQQRTVLSYMADERVQEGAAAGFTTVTEARRRATSERKPLVMYFNLRGAAPCEEQNRHLESTEFQQLAQLASFAWIDASEYPQLSQQMGVYRVPTWIFYDANGVERGKRIGVMTPTELASSLVAVRQQ